MYTMCLVVRHGETEWNAAGRIQGHRNVPLNDRGKKQAEAVGERLVEESFSGLYSSDLRRTMQTASAIASKTGHTIQTDVGLREWDLGVLAGLTRTEVKRRYPDVYASYARMEVDTVIPQGESIRERYLRTTATMAEIAAAHPGEKIVVVTHGGVLDDFRRRATGLSLDAVRDFELYNGGIHRFKIEAEDWRLMDWGDISHLGCVGTVGNWEGKEHSEHG